MDVINGSSRPRQRKTPSFDRFLGVPQTTQNENVEETELNEDDIFSTGDFSAESLNNHRNSPPSSAASTPRKPSFLRSDSFGILAALPELRPNPNHHHNHNFYQKSMLSTVSTVSSSSSTSPASSASSVRMIPTIPRAAPPGTAARAGYHQSAPVNVPVLTETMRRRRREMEYEEDEEESYGGGGDGEMLPPHEMVARQQTPIVASSVLEGVGRTLKGRDLRQVRNAVFRRTGFLD